LVSKKQNKKGLHFQVCPNNFKQGGVTITVRGCGYCLCYSDWQFLYNCAVYAYGI